MAVFLPGFQRQAGFDDDAQFGAMGCFAFGDLLFDCLERAFGKGAPYGKGGGEKVLEKPFHQVFLPVSGGAAAGEASAAP